MAVIAADIRPRSNLGLVVLDSHPSGLVDSIAEARHYGAPRRGLPDEVNEWRARNWPSVRAQVRKVLSINRLIKRARIPAATAIGQLSLKVTTPEGLVLPYGLAGLRVVTDTGVAFIVDAFQNILEAEIMKYHGFGTGGAAEAVGNTALTTELTTEYNPNSTRPTGSLAEGATGNIFKTVGTLTPDAPVAITEHGVFSQAATGGGTLLDRTLFSVMNIASGASLEATYQLTFTSGG